jgi:hypothetical protein
MNAAASALPRADEVRSKIQKIRTFGRNARIVCAVLYGLGLVISVIFLISAVAILFGPVREPTSPDGGGYDLLSSSLLPLPLKLCWLLGSGLMLALVIGTVKQLHRVFENLANGAIYTPENVRRVRITGVLWLLSAVLGTVMAAGMRLAHSYIDASIPIDFDRVLPTFEEMLYTAVTAAFILLVSWIMDVGLYEKDHADALRQEADLTI